MTREEQIIILTNAHERAFKQIDLTEGHEMGTEEFSRLLDVAGRMGWMSQSEPMPVPEMVPEEVQPAPTMSKEEVRDKLSTYSNKYDSLDVAAIMSDMGYGKLSDIPAEHYGELIKRVEDHIKDGV